MNKSFYYELISINNIFGIIFTHLMVCWFFSSKIYLVLSSRSSLPMFIPDLEKNLCHLVENEKKMEIILCLLKMVARQKQTSLNPVVFLLNMALRYHWEAQCFSYRWTQDIFLDFHKYIVPVCSISLHWVSDWSLKTQNE